MKAEKLLLLSDVDFLSTNVNYFKSIADLAMPPKLETHPDSEMEETLTAGSESMHVTTATAAALATTELSKEGVKSKPLPKLKVEANVKEFRVAIIEAVDEPQPQALTLKVFCYVLWLLTLTVLW